MNSHHTPGNGDVKVWWESSASHTSSCTNKQMALFQFIHSSGRKEKSHFISSFGTFWIISDFGSELNPPHELSHPIHGCACPPFVVLAVLLLNFLLTRGNTKKVFFLNNSPLLLLVMNPLHQARSNPAEFMPSDTLCHQRWITARPHASRVPKLSSQESPDAKLGGKNKQIKKPRQLFSGFKTRIKLSTRPQHYILKAALPARCRHDGTRRLRQGRNSQNETF